MTREFKKSTVREYFESIVIAVILALFIRTFIVQAFKIPTGSMEENLLIGDHLLVNKFVFGPTVSPLERALLPIGTVKRGDIVVFKYPEEPDRDFIKRVIGLPGETVEVREKKVLDRRQAAAGVVHALPPARRRAVGVPRGHVLRRARALRTGHRPRESVFRDGGQSRQLAGQPLLGLPPARLHQGQGARHLLVCTRRAARTTRRATRVRGLGSVFVHFFTRTRWDRMFHQIR